MMTTNQQIPKQDNSVSPNIEKIKKNTYNDDLNLNMKIDQISNPSYLCGIDRFHPDFCKHLKSEQSIQECEKMWKLVCASKFYNN